MSTSILTILSLTIMMALAHDLHKPLEPPVPTLVTAWWADPQSKQRLPSGLSFLQFQKLLLLPINMIIFGEEQLGDLISKKRSLNNTKFVKLDPQTLTNSWYSNKIQELKAKGQTLPADSYLPILSYSRMLLLKLALENDAFGTDEFIWVDGNAMSTYKISQFIQPNNLQALMTAFRHHFFILTTPKNPEIHAFPNIQKTYFSAKFDTFVSTQVFGGKRDSISTMNLIYEDMLRAVVAFDGNLWSEDAIWSVLADRSPFLISYLSADDIKPPQSKRLLDGLEFTFEREKETLNQHEQIIRLCETGIFIVAILVAWEIVKFLKHAKKLSEEYKSVSQFEMNIVDGQDSSNL